MNKQEEVSIYVFVEFSYIKNSEKCYNISVPISFDKNNKSIINLKNIIIHMLFLIERKFIIRSTFCQMNFGLKSF